MYRLYSLCFILHLRCIHIKICIYTEYYDDLVCTYEIYLFSIYICTWSQFVHACPFRTSKIARNLQLLRPMPPRRSHWETQGDRDGKGIVDDICIYLYFLGQLNITWSQSDSNPFELEDVPFSMVCFGLCCVHSWP